MLSCHTLSDNKFHKACVVSGYNGKWNCTTSKFGLAKHVRGHSIKFVSFEVSASVWNIWVQKFKHQSRAFWKLSSFKDKVLYKEKMPHLE